MEVSGEFKIPTPEQNLDAVSYTIQSIRFVTYHFFYNSYENKTKIILPHFIANWTILMF
jgi:hypothetical protein